MQFKETTPVSSIKPVRTSPKLWQASDVQELPIDWLWYPYIPRGTTSLIFGKGGLGKSTIACAITAALTNGKVLPGQPKPLQPANVLMLSAEDNMQRVLVPRLRKHGANMERVFIPEDTFVLDTQGLKNVEDYMHRCSAAIVFLDPVTVFLGGQRDMFRDNEVREMMDPLRQMAEKTNAAVILIGHQRKSTEGTMADLAAGSAGFVNSVRSTLYVTKDENGEKVLWHAKTNYGPLGKGIPYTIDENNFLSWGQILDVNEPAHVPRGRPRGKALEFIQNFLASGPQASVDVFAQGLDAGYSKSTMNRAKEELGIHTHAFRRNGTIEWYWSLIPMKGVPE